MWRPVGYSGSAVGEGAEASEIFEKLLILVPKNIKSEVPKESKSKEHFNCFRKDQTNLTNDHW